MKTDRILEIIIYLINHDNVPASYLAERFHVSVRTIQRDVVTISSIGIPVYSSGGRYDGMRGIYLPLTLSKKNTALSKLQESKISLFKAGHLQRNTEILSSAWMSLNRHIIRPALILRYILTNVRSALCRNIFRIALLRK